MDSRTAPIGSGKRIGSNRNSPNSMFSYVAGADVPSDHLSSVAAALRCLAGCRVSRIVEEELIAIGIIDHEESVAPGAFLD